MKILFIGTGAADWVLKERKEGEFFRRLTAVKINDDLMIDCSPDTADFAESCAKGLEGVKNIIITHTHSDHYSPDTVRALFGNKVRVWAEKAAEKIITRDLPELPESMLRQFFFFNYSSVAFFTASCTAMAMVVELAVAPVTASMPPSILPPSK